MGSEYLPNWYTCCGVSLQKAPVSREEDIMSAEMGPDVRLAGCVVFHRIDFTATFNFCIFVINVVCSKTHSEVTFCVIII